MNAPAHHEIVIVGGGVAGSYLYWRLGQTDYDVVLYEQGERIGGRLLSETPPNMPDLRAELGGMRYLSSQTFVTALIAQLGLATEPFPMGGAANIAYLRGRLLRDSQFTDPAAIPYFLAPSEQGKNPGQILVDAITTIVPDALTYTPQQWEAAKKTLMWKGRRLTDWGFWDAIYSIMSSEAYALLFEGGGYESLTDNWNAAEACQHLLADFPSNVSYQRITAGYDTLPATLAAQSEGDGIQMGSTLVSIAPGTSLRLALTFAVTTASGIETQVVETNCAFLAIPQLPLQNVFAKSTVFSDPALPNAILSTVTPMPAIKIFMGFSSAWWSAVGLSSGRSTTDLPLRQVYYFGQEQTNGDALLMATYSDGRTESFWRYLSREPGDPPKLVTELEQGHALRDEVVRQLSIMHGVTVPEPTWMTFVDWTVPPFGAGWHFWNAGIDVDQRIAGIRQPQAGLPLFICGEAYSNEQGWVEGAINSAELALRQGVPDVLIPAWLENIYFGP